MLRNTRWNVREKKKRKKKIERSSPPEACRSPMRQKTWPDEIGRAIFFPTDRFGSPKEARVNRRAYRNSKISRWTYFLFGHVMTRFDRSFRLIRRPKRPISLRYCRYTLLEFVDCHTICCFVLWEIVDRCRDLPSCDLAARDGKRVSRSAVVLISLFVVFVKIFSNHRIQQRYFTKNCMKINKSNCKFEWIFACDFIRVNECWFTIEYGVKLSLHIGIVLVDAGFRWSAFNRYSCDTSLPDNSSTM